MSIPFLAPYVLDGTLPLPALAGAVLGAGEAEGGLEGDDPGEMPLVDQEKAAPLLLSLVAAVKVRGRGVAVCQFRGGWVGGC